jgi:putative flavoprotein involved in K+ transport
MTEWFNTIIVGAGQSGLAISYYLTLQHRRHVLLEKRQIAEAWRSEKWDSFTLVSPNWSLRLPGFDYAGDDPDGYLTREEVVRYIETYVHLFNPPVRAGVEVTCVEGVENGFILQTSQGLLEADNVVVATGAFQKPKIPAYGSKIASHITQLHSSQYRNPSQLPDGANLVVGSGQSGCQIAEELYQQGRKVYLCTGSAVRIPRRYRGKEVFHWAEALGLFDQTVDTLSSPAERFAANPQLTGKDGGQALNLHQFAVDGVTLLGRLQNANGSKVSIAADLMENLTRADNAEAEFRKAVDSYIEKNAIQAPADAITELRAGYDSPIVTELDLDAEGITSVIWAAGYNVDFSWIKFPIFDAFGYPIHQRGVTVQPGLYSVGLPWLHKSKSNLFMGIDEDAAYIAEHIQSRG